jgi:hypothetical protein
MAHLAMCEFRMLGVEVREVRPAQARNLRLENDVSRLTWLGTGAVEDRLGNLNQFNAMFGGKISGKHGFSPE